MSRSTKPPQGTSAALLLARQLKEIQTDKDKDIPGISVGLVDDSNIFEWEVVLMIQEDVKYYGGAYSPFLPSPSPFLSNIVS
jgi:ubiquitin-conjugating enzyme E2 G1